MTAQIREKLIFNGDVCGVASEPLYVWLHRRRNKHIGFARRNTACSRGYVGTWEIIDQCLYLVKIAGKFIDGQDVELKDLFPGEPEPVFASWFDGELRCPMGKLLGYVHSGYSSVYESDLFLEFKQGKLIGQRTVFNQTPSSIERRGMYISELDVAPNQK